MQFVRASLIVSAILLAQGCVVPPTPTKAVTDTSFEDKQSEPARTSIPTLREVGTRGFFVLDGPFAEFDPAHPSVELWTPDANTQAPIIIYAHGGAGFREDDRARIELFRRNGFSTLSFDSYEMNGFEDWEFVTRRVANSGKQSMNWGVYKGAVEYALAGGKWDNRNAILYGPSNGGRVVLHAASQIQSENIKAVISEAPAGSGFELGDYDIPTIVLFGALDTWAGTSDTDYVWKRTYPGSPVSIEDWVTSLQSRGRPIEFIFYENAGHLMFDGALEKVTVKRGERIAFSAYKGAGDGVIEQYENDVISFVHEYTVP